MKALASYVLRGPMQAILVTSVTAFLSLLLPPLSYLSGAAVGLVTLHAGWTHGLKVIGGSLLATMLLSWLIFQTPFAGIVFLVIAWLPVWVLAISLRRSQSLGRSVRLAAVFGIMAILGFYLGVEEPAAWWRELLLGMLQQTQSAPGGLDGEAIETVAALMTGVMASALAISMLGSLLLARWWQALVVNPGGFRQEFHGLRLGRGMGLVSLLVLALALFQSPLAALAVEVLVLMGGLMMMQGLAMVHGLVTLRKANTGWLVGLYVLLILPMTMAQTMAALAVAGVIDNWFDFRNYFENKMKT